MNLPVQHVFVCKACGHPIRLPAQMLDNKFQNPHIPSSGFHSVGVVCFRCKLAANYSLLKHSPGYSPGYSSECSVPTLETIRVAELQCEEETCDIHLELYAQWSATTTVEERKADIAVWQPGDLRCPQGHPISSQWANALRQPSTKPL
jgi:hypothetical protein